MKKFRKKPVVIESVQFTGLNFDEIEAFVGGDYGKDGDGNQVIATLEGSLKISNGDFIIKGVKGEMYPCKPDIFEETYEKVEDGQERETATTVEELCNVLRSDIKVAGALVKQLKSHSRFKQLEDYTGQQSEMIANIMLAYRHLEDARMRVGKILQAAGDGVSILDKQ